MKKENIDPEIKSIIEQHTGSIGAWGPKEIYVEIKDSNFTKDLVALMKSKGWYLEEQEADDRNMFFHYGQQEKANKDNVLIDDSIKKEYAFRRSKYHFSSWIIIIAMGLLSVSTSKEFCAKWDFPPILFLIIGILLFIIGSLTWYIYWRCPVCGAHFLSDDNICNKCKSSFE
jgi:hypothetical protein